MVWIQVLGSFAAEVDGGPVPLGGPLQRAVLAVLVAARGQVVSADRLIDALWHDHPPAQALTSLQAYVSNLRKLLEPGRPPRTPARLLVSMPPGYALRLPDDAVDAWLFERLVREAGESDSRSALERALGLWRGPAFAEVADAPWAQAEAARLEELRLTAGEMRVAAALRAGDAAAAVPEAELLTREAPLREEGWRLHALALWRTGRQADALASLRRARGLLADELGLDPGPALAELESAILHQRSDLLPPPEPPPPAAKRDLFVGRDGELAALRDLAATRTPAVALVTGEAGMGKTALLTRFGRELEDAGWLVATGRCPQAEGAPPAWAWAEALRVVAAAAPPPGTLAPVLGPFLTDAATTTRADAAAGRFLLHQAVWSWLGTAARDQPLAVILDDLHWADAETLALLSGVTSRLLLVAAYRADEIGGRFTETLAVLARHEPLRLPLAGLAEQAVAGLVAGVCDEPVDASTVAELAERTGGNPFFVRESARLLGSMGLRALPDGVRDVLRRRLARLPEPAVALLRLAALAGPEVSVDVLVRAADQDEDGVLLGLESAVVAGLLTEPEPGRVRFAHALVRESAIADLSRLRATRMHARLADAIAAVSPGDVSVLAYHYTRATSPKAVDYCVAAAELAEARFAYDSAVTLLTDAVSCIERVPGGNPARRADLLGRLLRAQVRAGDVSAARATRQRAVELAGDDVALLIAAFTAWTEQTPWQTRAYGTLDRQTVALLERLLAEPDLEAAARCMLLDAYACELAAAGLPAARAAAEEAVALATALDDPALLWRTLSTLSYDLDPALDWRRRQELGERIATADSPGYQWYGLFVQASAAAGAGEPERVKALVAQSLELARKYRMAEPASVAEYALATLLHISGRSDEARRLYAEATARMAAHGSLHATGYGLLAELSTYADIPAGGVAGEEFMALAAALLDGYGALGADAAAIALAAQGRLEEAREARAKAGPIPPDYFFPVFATFRAMAVIALAEVSAAEEVYEALLPYEDGPPAGPPACRSRCGRWPTRSASWPGCSAARMLPVATSPARPPSPSAGAPTAGPRSPTPPAASHSASGEDGVDGGGAYVHECMRGGVMATTGRPRPGQRGLHRGCLAVPARVRSAGQSVEVSLEDLDAALWTEDARVQHRVEAEPVQQ
ncbi:BTAD domain-containing putative transcriptional regulator [Streptosporangium sp. NPDC000396]|uniref:BTAD domain-containing putative transcriptional regulator n=1 Tax=Streptosporangium sp. NPDC000396 TaxID=3366185 RepID=UPI00367C515D